jgi:hypothetical protein
MSPLAARFEDVGAPAHLAQIWFGELLRDGFALTVSGVAEPFGKPTWTPPKKPTGSSPPGCHQGSGHGVIFREWFGASFELEGAVPW